MTERKSYYSVTSQGDEATNFKIENVILRCLREMVISGAKLKLGEHIVPLHSNSYSGTLCRETMHWE
jgi:hypothetical protein